MIKESDHKTKVWFTSYVKGTTWIGCKTPIVKQIVKNIIKEHDYNKDYDDHNDNNVDNNNTSLVSLSLSSKYIYQESIKLLKHDASDVKLAGMILLSEYIPLHELATISIINQLENILFIQNTNIINDWSTLDWFSIRVLQPMIGCLDGT